MADRAIKMRLRCAGAGLAQWRRVVYKSRPLFREEGVEERVAVRLTHLVQSGEQDPKHPVVAGGTTRAVVEGAVLRTPAP